MVSGNERATVAGLGALAQYIGIIIALAVTPLMLFDSSEGIVKILWIYGINSLAGSAMLLVFMRDEPPTPPTTEEFTNRTAPIKGIADIFKIRDMQ